MKIKKLNPLLPAIVEYEDFEQTYQMFVYINGDDVVIPDDNVVITDEFKKDFLDAWKEFMSKQKKPLNVPTVPKSGFDKADSSEFYNK
jgi:hypothetical protein